MRKPVVAIVGRPNVGKSTLYNRLAGERLAVVDDIPGTTRDRLITEIEWAGVVFDIIDTGGIDPSEVKIGNGREPLSVNSADFIDQIRTQAEIAIRDADAILFITDVDSGITPADVEVSQILRRFQKKMGDQLRPPILLVVNKCDSDMRIKQAMEFYELGLGEPYPISAIHGIGIGDLLDRLVDTFTDFPLEGDEYESVKIAIVGKPNVGKSSLLNRILGEERSIVSPIPGTTRDAIDTFLEFDGIPITLIDTAGIRKRGQISPGVEKFSVIRSFKAIQRADVAILLVDATVGLTAQDAHIAGWIIDAWKSVVVAVNKWDAIEKDTYTIEDYKRTVRHHLNFMEYVPILFISAKTGQRVNQVLPTALQVQEERLVRLATSQVNQIIRKAMDRHPPPSKSGRHLKIYYGTQVRSDPPTFILHVNDPKLAHFTYVRFLKNRIRESYAFMGTPIRIILKQRI